MKSGKIIAGALLVCLSSAIPVWAVSPSTLRRKIDEHVQRAERDIASIQQRGMANPAGRPQMVAELDRLKDKLRKSRQHAEEIESRYNPTDRAACDAKLQAAHSQLDAQFAQARQALGGSSVGAPVIQQPANQSGSNEFNDYNR